MSTMTDYDAGRLVTQIENLSKQVESLNMTTVTLSKRINELEKQLVKGKGFLAGAMLYLNDVPEGEGETEFLHQGMRVQPRKGDLVVWPAFFTHVHRGNPVYTTDKYIATGWMLWDHPPEQETK